MTVRVGKFELSVVILPYVALVTFVSGRPQFAWLNRLVT
jgi:hypothetical protein